MGPRQRLRRVRPDGSADGDARRPSVARGACSAIFQQADEGRWPRGRRRTACGARSSIGPGAYREETATAMILTAMARGVRLGWLDRSYTPSSIAPGARSPRTSPTTAAWSTSAAEPAPARPRATTSIARRIEGPDDRGGAMALVAAMERFTIRRNRGDRKERREKSFLLCVCLCVLCGAPRFLPIVSLRDDVVDHVAETSVSRKSRPL